MEVRAIVAFVLSLLVFAGWNFFIESRHGKGIVKAPSQLERIQVSPTESVSPEKAGESGIPSVPVPARVAGLSSDDQTSKEKAAKPFDTSLLPAKAAKDVTVTLKNDTIIFTTAGAGIKSFLLSRYKDLKGKPLELIPSPEGNIASPQVILDDKNLALFVGRSIYDASTDNLNLSETNPTGTLAFSLKDPSGLEIIKEYSFAYNSYKIDCTIKMNYGNEPLKTLKVSWNNGIESGRIGKDSYTYEGPTTLVGFDRETDAKNLEEGPVRHGGDLKWTAYQNKYFAVALIPLEKNVTAVIEKGRNGVATVGLEYGMDTFPFEKKFSFFLGPKESEQLDQLKKISLSHLIDYGWFGNFFAFLVRPLFNFLQFFYHQTGNYGWSIIILTVVIKVLFFPLSQKSFKSMKNMQKIQPEIKILQERYKDDRQMLSKELMRVYRENKVNPMGGCLPMILQIPVFIALYQVLLVSIELRNAPFIFWLHDLSEKDPYYVTPIIMGASMFLQQRMSPAVGDPTQQKMMMILPLVFTFLFLNFPSGLVIYWLVNNILTVTQQYYINTYSK
jgi:YidC/Oxa1 family membrane protein insertase